MKDPWSHVPLGVDYRNAWKWEPKMVSEARRQANGRIGQREIKRLIAIPLTKILDWLASTLPEGTR